MLHALASQSLWRSTCISGKDRVGGKVDSFYSRIDNKRMKIRERMVAEDTLNVKYIPRSDVLERLLKGDRSDDVYSDDEGIDPVELGFAFTSPTETIKILGDFSGNSIVVRRCSKSGMRRWWNGSGPPSSSPWTDLGVIKLEDDDAEEKCHCLVHEFSYLSLLKDKGVAVKPVYLSPPAPLGTLSNGFSLYRRFMVVALSGDSVENYIRESLLRPLEKAVALKIGMELTKTLERLHRLGVSHGDVNPRAVLFRHGTDISKGLILRNFARAKSDPRGLPLQAVADVQGILSVMGEMNVNLLELASGDVTSAIPGLSEAMTELKLITYKIQLVKQIDYPRIKACIQRALTAVLST